MNRFSALVLLGLFSFLLIAPLALDANAQSQLPACCRLDGQHHCSTMGQSWSSAAMQSAAEKCPYSPYGKSVPAQSSPLMAVAAPTTFGFTDSFRTAQAPAESYYRSAFCRNHPERGPPSPLS